MKRLLVVALLLVGCEERAQHDARDFQAIAAAHHDCIAIGDGWSLTWASEYSPDDRKCECVWDDVMKRLGRPKILEGTP